MHLLEIPGLFANLAQIPSKLADFERLSHGSGTVKDFQVTWANYGALARPSREILIG
jgi:hypothetical protein